MANIEIGYSYIYSYVCWPFNCFTCTSFYMSSFFYARLSLEGLVTSTTHLPLSRTLTLVSHSHTSRWHSSIIHIHQDDTCQSFTYIKIDTRQSFTYMKITLVSDSHTYDTRQPFTYIKMTLVSHSLTSR